MVMLPDPFGGVGASEKLPGNSRGRPQIRQTSETCYGRMSNHYLQF